MVSVSGSPCANDAGDPATKLVANKAMKRFLMRMKVWSE
jgi:hypothetical protein